MTGYLDTKMMNEIRGYTEKYKCVVCGQKSDRWGDTSMCCLNIMNYAIPAQIGERQPVSNRPPKLLVRLEKDAKCAVCHRFIPKGWAVWNDDLIRCQSSARCGVII